MYSPLLARFLSPDSLVPNPANPVDLNRYAYVRHNPLKYVNPTGHTAVCISCRRNYQPIDEGNTLRRRGGDIPVQITEPSPKINVPLGGSLGPSPKINTPGATVGSPGPFINIPILSPFGENGRSSKIIATQAKSSDSYIEPRTDVWPSSPEEIVKKLAVTGKRIPDSRNTPGRNKVIWKVRMI
ncbi:MAG: RHS repeat-associated core domain-containing protein [Anaerolineae bacterium]|nr:hypothetical protein [Candidatus Roseilinea sp.]MDW8449796.1 RHS repeat-associated core domain-containing protein [Anaerolineae bacterium]